MWFHFFFLHALCSFDSVVSDYTPKFQTFSKTNMLFYIKKMGTITSFLRKVCGSKHKKRVFEKKMCT